MHFFMFLIFLPVSHCDQLRCVELMSLPFSFHNTEFNFELSIFFCYFFLMLIFSAALSHNNLKAFVVICLHACSPTSLMLIFFFLLFIAKNFHFLFWFAFTITQHVIHDIHQNIYTYTRQNKSFIYLLTEMFKKMREKKKNLILIDVNFSGESLIFIFQSIFHQWFSAFFAQTQNKNHFRQLPRNCMVVINEWEKMKR